MTYQNLSEILSASGIPFAFHHWESPPDPPYGVYYDGGTSNLFADDQVYISIRDLTLELYLAQRDEDLESRFETMLDGAELPWEKSVTYIEPLRLYQISYETEVY